ncbi:MAG: hypothetical protein LC793_09150, partial [Thermomicrobia bacterium]|nr:hypothetical protein [Thermomicrobia bacterium]
MSHHGDLPILRQSTLTPPAPYALDLTAIALARFPRRLNRWDGTVYRRLFVAEGVFVAVAVRQEGAPADPRLLLTFTGPAQVPPFTLDRLTGYVVRMLGAADDITPFLTVAARDPVVGPLTAALPG